MYIQGKIQFVINAVNAKQVNPFVYYVNLALNSRTPELSGAPTVLLSHLSKFSILEI